MRQKLKELWQRLSTGYASVPALDVMLAEASPRDPLQTRLNWLVDLLFWVRHSSSDEKKSESRTSWASARLRQMLNVLDLHPEWKLNVAQTLRSIVRESSAIELFCETGLPRESGFLSEAGERMINRMLPPLPNSAELGALFERLFPHHRDQEWIEQIDNATIERLLALFHYEVSESEKDWNSLERDMEDALLYLASLLRVAGASATVRTRIQGQKKFRDLPFLKLNMAVQAVLAAREANDLSRLTADLNYLRAVLDTCARAASGVHEHLEEYGVSAGIVYQLARINALLERMEALLELLFDTGDSGQRLKSFIVMLVRENQARESVSDLVKQNLTLLTRKMVERNAETGEHYIARTPTEYRAMIRHAAGGGFIMAFTTWFKTVLFGWHLPLLMQGLGASINYAGSFVAIQMCGFTVATKQPATTAPALAARMHQVREPKALAALVEEVVCLIRSQVAAIIGNLTFVMPGVLMIHLVIQMLTHSPMMSETKAVKTIESLSVLGPSIFFAALTGVLLWLSSLVAAWADNWFAYRRMEESLKQNRRLNALFGTLRAQKIAHFFAKNMTGFGGNISLGFMLGLFPEIAAFAGLPLDVRHVTLSTGSLTAAVASLGCDVMFRWSFLSAILGIMGIGLMNVTVSFSLAMFVAIRARNIKVQERRAIYSALWERFKAVPLSFVFPVRNTTSPENVV